METKGLDYYELIKRVDGMIDDAATAGLNETAALLRIARLDLVTRANGIGEKDLDLFLRALEQGPVAVEERDGPNNPVQKVQAEWLGVRGRRTLRSSRRYSRART